MPPNAVNLTPKLAGRYAVLSPETRILPIPEPRAIAGTVPCGNSLRTICLRQIIGFLSSRRCMPPSHPARCQKLSVPDARRQRSFSLDSTVLFGYDGGLGCGLRGRTLDVACPSIRCAGTGALPDHNRRLPVEPAVNATKGCKSSGRWHFLSDPTPNP